jgi:hypothetical protein
MAVARVPADDGTGVRTADPKGEQMTVVVLKRKLRNFPSGKLSERLAAA